MQRAVQIQSFKITQMVSFSDQMPFPVGSVILEPENVSHSSGFPAAAPVRAWNVSTGRGGLI